MSYGGAVAHIHTHTEYSTLDGEQTIPEAFARAADLGGHPVAVTDHGTCTGHPQAQHEGDKLGLQVMFGLETYFQPDRLIRPAKGDKEAQKRLQYGKHLVLIATDNQGLSDLWALSSEAHRTGHYQRPRVDWDLLEQYGSRLIATTACLGGIVAADVLQAIVERSGDALDRVFATLGRLKSIFGDRLYLELQANELPQQRIMNQGLVMLSDAMRIPLVMADDSHFPAPEDAELHKTWMACQSGKGREDYWHFSAMLSADRMRELTGYLDPAAVDRALAATMEIAARCDARIDAHFEPPVFGASHEEDARQLLAMCRSSWDRVPGGQLYLDRLETEFGVVAGKNMAGCYLMVEELVSWVKSQGGLVGPGRGSAAGSLMSYLLGITSTDPIPARLLFSRFLTPGRASLPDFDLDFATRRRPGIQRHVVERYGEDHVIRVGTIMRYGIRGILNKLFSVMGENLDERAEGDSRQISRIIEDAEIGTAGLGLPLDEILAERALADYIARYDRIFRIAGQLHNRVYAYGKHPAGLIINPKIPLTGLMPTRSQEGEMPVGEWDYRVADAMGLFKLDCLTVRTLDTAEEAIRLIEERHGIRIDPWSWSTEHEDPQVWREIAAGQTRGMFQVETPLCTSYCERMQPAGMAELADLTTFIRPGPRNSGQTESYLRRRAGTEAVAYPHPLLEGQLRDSYGVALYQEDVMAACELIAGYSQLEADGVRKILGKKLTDRIEAAGKEFVRRCTERGHDEAQVRALWESMAEFGKYAFNRAHGYSYAVMSYWTAWLKTHYPVEMITAILSTLGDMDRMAAFATDARRLGISVLPPDVRHGGVEFTAEGLSVRYGLGAIGGVGPAAISQIRANQPYFSFADFKARSGVDAGVLYALAKAGALDSLAPSRRGMVLAVEAERNGDDVRCVHKTAENTGPHGLPCSYDWAKEPVPPPRFSAKTGRELKVIIKPPPALCTRKCRRYTPPEALDMGSVPEYPAADLFRHESAIYGTWMSESAFSRLDDVSEGLREQARLVALMIQSAPPGRYPLAAVYGGHHTALTRAGNKMWWVTLVTEAVMFELAAFEPRLDSDVHVPALLRQLQVGDLVSAQITKNRYESPGKGMRTGWRLTDIWPAGGS